MPSQDSVSPSKKWAFRVLAVALSVLASFLALEIALRILGPKYYRFDSTQHGFYSNPRGYFDIWRKEGNEVVYGIEVYAGGAPLRRVPEYIEEDEDILAFLNRNDTILGLGDSFTMGKGVRYEDLYLRRLEKQLQREGRPVRIRNAARHGNDIDDICAVYDAHSAAVQYPLVIYGFVLNDFGLPGMEGIVGSDYITINNGGYHYNPWRRLASINFVCDRLERIRLDRVTRRAYLQAFQGRNASQKFALLRGLNRTIRTGGGELVLVLFPLLHDFDNYPFQEPHMKVASFCQKENIPLLDLLPAFSKHKARDLWVHFTDYHPNEIAHKIAADEIYGFLKREGLLELLPAGDRQKPLQPGRS